jgi:hypothetical protein
VIVGAGRPLRFLLLVGVGWTTLRVVALWQETGSLPRAIRDAVPLVAPVQRALASTSLPSMNRVVPHANTASRVSAGEPRVSLLVPKASPILPAAAPSIIAAAEPVTRSSPFPAPTGAASASVVQLALTGSPQIASAAGAEPQAQTQLPRALAQVERTNRLTGSGWLIARGGRGLGASATAPQLGGAQGGVRLDYAIGHGLAATGRVAAPAAGAGREVSLGVAWRPAGVPLRFVAEQRVAIDGGRSGPSLGVSGGVFTRLPARFRLESYAQAGLIARDGLERYADGIVRVARPIASPGAVSLDLGVGAWGGAQRGVARLDVGPSAGLAVPLADRTIRVALDWRQRVAGQARPGSGPALSIGSDF